MNLEITNTPELKTIEDSKAVQIKKTFEPMVEMLETFEGSYQDIITASELEITEAVTKKAKRLRLDIGKVRISTEKLRKTQKEEYLRAGKAIDGVSNIVKWAITDKESKLKEIEDYFTIQENKRLEALQAERVSLISEFVEDASDKDLSSMDQDVWESYLSTKKKDFQDQKEAEAKAEADRIERERLEAEEKAKLKAENDRLKAEAEDRAKAEKIESDLRVKKEAERLAKEQAEKAERDAKEQALKDEIKAKEKAESDRVEAEKLEAIRVENERIEKLENERLEVERLETERLAKIEADKQAELNKGDSAKIKDLVLELTEIKEKYSFKSKKNTKKMEDVRLLIDKVISHIKKEG